MRAYIWFINIGNVGIEENYVFAFICLSTMLIAHIAMKPIAAWALKNKLYKLVTYGVSSLVAIFFIFLLTLIRVDLPAAVFVKYTLQFTSLVGFVLSMKMIFTHLFSKTSASNK